jgi:hypothetical protein
MKRTLVRRRGLFLFAGALLALAGIAWGAGFGTHAVAPHAAAAINVAGVRHLNSPSVSSPSATSPAAVSVAAPSMAPASTSIQSSPVAGEAGMRIFKDPETGEVGPPTAENAAILASESQTPVDVSSIPEVRLPNGGWKLMLQGRVEDAVIMKIDAKGNRVMTCVTDPKAALKAPASAPAQQREDR